MLKLLLTLAVIVAAWYVFKSRRRINRQNVGKVGRALDAARSAMAESAKARDARQNTAGPPKSGTQPPIDLHPCPKCGAYVAVGMTCSCSKA